MNFDFFQFFSTTNPFAGISSVLHVSCFCIAFVTGSEVEIIFPLLSVIMIAISELAIDSDSTKCSASSAISNSGYIGRLGFLLYSARSPCFFSLANALHFARCVILLL
ncbi:Uncharacterised protein [Streptococcus pneumoniae]|nr:Uncharacterised protein [Streptococcus pneumoniae]